MIDILSKLEQELRYEANMEDRVGVAIGALMVFRRLKDDSLTSTWCHFETEEVNDNLKESIARALRNLADSIYKAPSDDLPARDAQQRNEAERAGADEAPDSVRTED